MAHLLDALLVVKLSVVVLTNAAHALPYGKMLWVNGDTVVIVLATSANEGPTALLLLEIETGGVWHEEPGNKCTTKTEPWDDVELGLGVDVVVKNGSSQCSKLTAGGGETVSSRTNGGRVDFSGGNESNGVWSELVEEGGKEVHGLESVGSLGTGVVFEVEGRDDEEDEVGNETDNHHPLASVELVVDEEGGHVVTNEGDTDVAKVPQPADHDGLVAWSEGSDELRLEKLVAVKEDVVGVPGTSSSDHAWTKVSESKLKGLSVVTSDLLLLLGCGELLRSGTHLVGTVVDQPQGTDSWDGERDTVSPLGSDLRVWRATGTVVEDQEQQDQDYLVEELTPTLHQESGCDLAATVKTVVPGRNLAGADSVLHTRGGSHWVLASNTDTVEEQRPDVANDPAVLSNTPGGGKHDETEEHDHGILNKTPAASEPVTDDTDEDLTDDDTANFEIVDSLDPGRIADCVLAPAGREGSLEKWLYVADGEKDVTERWLELIVRGWEAVTELTLQEGDQLQE